MTETSGSPVFQHIPGVTEPLPGSPAARARRLAYEASRGGPDVGINRWGEPEYEPLIPADKHGIRYQVVTDGPNSGIAYVGAPRCPWDGAAMPYVVEARYYSFGNPPDPAYLFECPLCSWTDEIS